MKNIVPDMDLWIRYINSKYETYRIRIDPSSRPIRQSNSLDLHGLTVEQAFNKTGEFIDQHTLIGTKNIEIITGKSGQIKSEFESWCSNKFNKSVRTISLKENGGSWQVSLKSK